MDRVVTRRALNLRDPDDVIREAQSLLTNGYDKAGNWDLAQVCGHVTDWMSYPLDGFPAPPLPVRILLGLTRVTVGKRKLRGILENGSMPAGGPTLRATIPAPGGDAAAAVARLSEVAERLRAHEGPFHRSPLFGDLDRETLIRLNVLHAAHHLSFLVPKH